MRPENKSAIQKNVDVEIRNFLDEYIDISAIINDVIERVTNYGKEDEGND